MSPTTPMAMDGIRVLDLTKLLPGPLATKHLAEMGKRLAAAALGSADR